MLKSWAGLLTNDLDALKQKETTGCVMEVWGCKAADAKSKINSLVDELRHDTFESYASIWHNVDQPLLAVGSLLRKVIYREGMDLQRGFYEALSNVADGVQQSFGNAPEVVDRSIGLIVGHAKDDNSARPGPSTAHSANRSHQQNQ